MADADTAMPDADTVMESEAGHEIPQDDYAASEDEFVSTKSVLMGSDEGLLTVDIANSKTSPDLDVIAVHGLHGDGQDVWASSDGAKPWLISRVFDKLPWAYCWIRFLTYRYSNSPTSPYVISNLNAVRQHAEKLLESLRLERFDDQGNAITDRPIIFVCEGIGGLIVKQAMILAMSDPGRFGVMVGNIRTMIFFGYPHRVARLHDMEDIAFKLLIAGAAPQTKVIERVQYLAGLIMQINRDFSNTNLSLRISMVNVFSTADELALRVFDEAQATMGIPFEIRIGLSKSHNQLARDPGDETWVQKIYQRLGHTPYPLSDCKVNCLTHLLALASPLTPIGQPVDHENRFEMLGSEETFQNWAQRPDTSILFAYGQDDLRSASYNIYELLCKRKENGHVIHFEFDSQDHRYDTVQAMLSTILAQIACRYYDRFANVMDERLGPHIADKIWNDRILYQCWMDLLPTDPCIPTTYLISALDQCKSPIGWFLDALVQMSSKSERRLKIVITTADKSGMRQHSEGVAVLDLDKVISPSSRHYGSTSLNTHLNFDSGLSETAGCQTEHIRLKETVLSACSSDGRVSQLVEAWLSRRNSPGDLVPLAAKLRALASVSCYSLDTVVATILGFLPPDMQSVGRRTIALVSGCFQTLTPTEVDAFLVSDSDEDISDYEHTSNGSPIKMIFRYIGTIITVIDGSVTLVPPAAQDLLVRKYQAASTHWYDFADFACVHGEIAQNFLAYLCRQGIQNEMHALWTRRDEEFPTAENRHHLLAYIVSHWPTHYKLANQDSGLREKALNFFKLADGEPLRRWARVHYLLSNPVTRPEHPLTSPLAIASALGLDDLVYHFLQSRMDEHHLALVEAVRNGQLETLRILIAAMEPGIRIQKEVLDAALSCQNPDCLKEVVTSVARYQDPGPSWPPQLLQLVCVSGLVDAAERLIESGAEIDGMKRAEGTATDSQALERSDPREVRTEQGDEVESEGQSEVEIVKEEAKPLPGNLPAPLYVATEYGQDQIVEMLLRKNADPNALNAFGRTALEAASISGRVDLAKALMKAGARLGALCSEDWTPLQAACVWGKYGMIQTLVETMPKAKMDQENDKPCPVVKCAQEGYTKCIKILIAEGANKEAGGESGTSPLQEAVNHGHTGVCKVLLDAKASADVEFDNTHILTSAAKTDIVEIVNLLMTHLSGFESQLEINNEAPNSSKYMTPISEALFDAAGRGSLAMVDCLIRWKANVNWQTDDKRTPVFAASYDGHANVVQRLVDEGADVNLAADSGWAPLQIAYDSAAVTSVLMSAQTKPDINRVTTSSNNTALYLASRHNFIRVVEILLENGADPDQKCEKEQTPLIAANREGNSDVVRVLLEAGANVNACTSHGTVAIHHAVWFDKPSRNDACLRSLLEYSPDLKMVDKDGDTALHCVRETTPVLLMKLLINAGADPNVINNAGHTALAMAILADNFSVAEYLVSKRVQIDRGTSADGGPIHLACRKANLKYVKMLVKHGANVNLPGSTLEVGTPLQSACLRTGDNEEQRQIVEYLLDNEHSRAQLNKEGGIYGWSINVAALMSPLETIQELLNRDADVTLVDSLGRNPAHLASLRTVNHVKLIATAAPIGSKLFSKRDMFNRTALHYAVGSGRLNVVKEVLDVISAECDCAKPIIEADDTDGWTPLMWAARTRSYETPGLSGDDIGGEQEAIVRFLVEEKGANLRVHVSRFGQDWSPLKLAKYHGASFPTLELLVPSRCEVTSCLHTRAIGSKFCLDHSVSEANPAMAEGSDDGDSEGILDSRFYDSKKAQWRYGEFCAACLFEICGAHFRCLDCVSYLLCFKCWPSQDMIHPEHQFKGFGEDFNEDSDSSEAGSDDGNDSSSS